MRRAIQRIEKFEKNPEIARSAISPNSINGNKRILSGDCFTKPSSVTCLMVAKKPVLVADKIISEKIPSANTNL